MLIINSPLEQFVIHNFISLKHQILGYIQLAFSNFVLYALLSLSLILLIFINAQNNNYIEAIGWSTLCESLLHTILNKVEVQIGYIMVYFPLIMITFNFVLFANLLSFIPY